MIIKHALINRDHCEQLQNQPLQVDFDDDGSIGFALIEGLTPYSVYSVYIGIRYQGQELQISQTSNKTAESKNSGFICYSCCNL